MADDEFDGDEYVNVIASFFAFVSCWSVAMVMSLIWSLSHRVEIRRAYSQYEMWIFLPTVIVVCNSVLTYSLKHKPAINYSYNGTYNFLTYT